MTDGTTSFPGARGGGRPAGHGPAFLPAPRLAAAALCAALFLLGAPVGPAAWNGTRQDTRLANETGDGTYTSPGAALSGIADSRTMVNIYYPSGCAWDAAARVLVCRDAEDAVTSRAADEEGSLGESGEGSGASALDRGNPFAEADWLEDLPVGFLVAWPSATDLPGSTSDEGLPEWLECDGQAISADDYPELAALVGETLPDLSGAFLRGATDEEIASGALAQVVADSLPGHTHTIPVGSVRTASAESDGESATAEGHVVSDSLDEDATFSSSLAGEVTAMVPDGETTLATGTSGGEETRPANRAVRVYIRALP